MFMFGLAYGGIAVALAHMPLLTLWFLAGTIRLASFAPTVASIMNPGMSGRSGTAGIVAGLIVGGAVFGIGAYTGDALMRTTGMLLSIFVSTLVLVVGEILKRGIPVMAAASK